MKKIEQFKRPSSDEGEIVSEIDYHVPENELSFDEEFHQAAILTSNLLNKDGKTESKSEPQTSCCRCMSENLVKMTLGTARYAASRIEDEYSAFILIFPPVVVKSY